MPSKGQWRCFRVTAGQKAAENIRNWAHIRRLSALTQVRGHKYVFAQRGRPPYRDRQDRAFLLDLAWSEIKLSHFDLLLSFAGNNFVTKSSFSIALLAAGAYNRGLNWSNVA